MAPSLVLAPMMRLLHYPATLALPCDSALEHVANHEMAPAGGTTPIEMVPADPTQKYDTDYSCAHTNTRILLPELQPAKKLHPNIVYIPLGHGHIHIILTYVLPTENTH